MSIEPITLRHGEITKSVFDGWARPVEQRAIQLWDKEGESEEYQVLRSRLSEYVIGQLTLFPEEE